MNTNTKFETAAKREGIVRFEGGVIVTFVRVGFIGGVEDTVSMGL